MYFMQYKILTDLEQRVKDMLETDKQTGEHSDATALDYVRWAIQEIENNPSREIPSEWITRIYNDIE